MATKKRKPRRPPPPLPAPRWSSRLYLRLDPSRVGMFRFLLEAEDNLGYMTVVDRWEAVLQVVFSPHQERSLRRRLEDMRELLPFTFVGPLAVEANEERKQGSALHPPGGCPPWTPRQG